MRLQNGTVEKGLQYAQLLMGVLPHADHRGRVAVSVQPKAGLMLLHLHGNDCLEHEAAPVTAGVKYILRSDVVFQNL